jgi:hypothetical protein
MLQASGLAGIETCYFVTFIMEEKRYNEHSYFQKYIQIMPDQFPNCPLFFKEQEKELLLNTELEKTIEI